MWVNKLLWGILATIIKSRGHVTGTPHWDSTQIPHHLCVCINAMLWSIPTMTTDLNFQHRSQEHFVRRVVPAPDISTWHNCKYYNNIVVFLAIVNTIVMTWVGFHHVCFNHTSWRLARHYQSVMQSMLRGKLLLLYKLHMGGVLCLKGHCCWFLLFNVWFSLSVTHKLGVSQGRWNHSEFVRKLLHNYLKYCQTLTNNYERFNPKKVRESIS